MADTARSKSALAALFADNSNGDISPQDLRDFLESMHASYGGLFESTPAATSISVAGTYYKIAGTTQASNVRNFTHTDNRLTYDGTPDIHAHIAADLSFTVAGNNKIVGVKLAKNGVVVGHAVRRKVGTGADVGAMPYHFDVMLSTNDYIELFLTNETDTSAVTVDNIYMFALGMFM